MEVDFPVSDDDSIYHSDGDTFIERPPLEPDAIILTGEEAKELDRIMAGIEAEEMSSDEEGDESGSEASSDGLTESIDPTSDDDMLDVNSKAPNGLVRELDDVQDEEKVANDVARAENNDYEQRHLDKIPDPTNVTVLTSAVTDENVSSPDAPGKPNTSILTEENSNKLPVDVSDKAAKPPVMAIPINSPVMEPRNSSDDDDYMVSVPGQNRSVNHPDTPPADSTAQLKKDENTMPPVSKMHSEGLSERALAVGTPMEVPTADTPHENGFVSDFDSLDVNGAKPRTMEPVTPISEEEGLDDVAQRSVKANGASPLPVAVEESDDDDFKDCEDDTKAKLAADAKDKFTLDGANDTAESVDVTEISLDKKTSLDVPDVEDIKQQGGDVPKQADLEDELDASNSVNRSIGGKGDAPTTSVVPDFPLMDEIAITSPAAGGNENSNGKRDVSDSSEGSKKSGEGSDLASDVNSPSVSSRKAISGSTLAIGGSKWRSRKSEIISREDVAAREKLVAARAKSELTVGALRDSGEPGDYLEMRTEEEKKEEERHLRLEETLKSQIATLRSARSGFVDLALLTPMTEKTELDKLRHELFVLKRELNRAERIKSGEQLKMKNRREKADKELRAATESKETMERNLEQRKAMLENYKSEVSRLEKCVQDLEGDWE